ncbi:unnamed protein product [Cuscuta campestris]|uniref:PLATZ transcription factor family protein n=1 Tax=Cuscuta campestris TaxID=132261 RepID=A0A484M465_9ASTE|nr:unnamed protein product [Cuscuta campestris]
MTTTGRTVRRYVYQNVIRLEDLEKLIDCAYIQPYTINSAKVIFLNQRTQSKSCNNNKTSASSCFTCDRILQDPFSFCSLSCKVDFMAYHEQDLSDIILFKFDDESGVPFSPFEEELRMGGGSESLDADDREITLHSSLEDRLACKNTACSRSSTMGNSGISQNVATKSGPRFLPRFMVSVSNRRKGAPSRSPFS